jgi:ribose 5-phosphate isomerase A
MIENVEALKRQAGEKAVEAIRSGMVVGLGTGSTAVHAVRALGELLRAGRLRDIVAIPTSEATAADARAWGIPLTTLSAHPVIDVTIDGADEIDPQLNLIKGLGGALLREKIVAVASRRVIIISDDRKLVQRLGTRAPLPVEVIPFAQRPVADYLAGLGARVVLRGDAAEEPFITDEGNLILDCHFDGGIGDAAALATAVRAQPGVVEHGLFLGLAAEAIIAAPDGIHTLQAPERSPDG